MPEKPTAQRRAEGQRLKDALHDAGYSYASFAAALDVPRLNYKTVARWCRGRSGVSVLMRARIAHVLHLKVEAIWRLPDVRRGEAGAPAPALRARRALTDREIAAGRATVRKPNGKPSKKAG